MTKLAQTSELGIVPVRIGNVTLRLVTDPALIKRALELDDPPTLGRGRFTRVASWYREGIFVITSGPEHARQRDTLGRPIWNDPRTPGIAQRRAAAMIAGWREGEPVDVWRAFRRLHFETDWEQLTGEQADEPVLRAFETGDVWQPRADPAGRDAALAAADGPRRPQGERADRRARRRARRAAAPGAGPGGGGPALAPRAAGRRGRRDDRRAAPRDGQAPVPGPDPRLPDVDLLGPGAQPGGRGALAGGDRPRAGGRPRDRSTTSPASRTCTVSCWRRCGSIRRRSGSSARRCRTSTSTGHAIPAGDVVVMSQWVTHRDPRLWDDPLRFDPDRWAEGVPHPPELTYFPFSAGPHGCHGSQQALREATVVAATVSQRWRLRAESDEEPAFALGIGLQPKTTAPARPRRAVGVAPTSLESKRMNLNRAPKGL